MPLPIHSYHNPPCPMSATLQPQVFTFLKALAAHNDRDWFTAHKADYQAAYDNFKAFAHGLQDLMTSHDELARMQVHRIYRDVRFSKDKTPYKSNFSGFFERATKWRRGGYYFHIAPGNTFVGGGFWDPEKADLQRIRTDLAPGPETRRAIIAAPDFVKTFGQLHGEQLKTAPAGYPKDHPAIDLLRYKQFLISHSFTDQEALSPDFPAQAAQVFQKMRPFFDYMSEVLTTDENGVPIE